VPDNFTVRPDVESDDVQDVSPVGKLSGHPRSDQNEMVVDKADNEQKSRPSAVQPRGRKRAGDRIGRLYDQNLGY
jgi:hypothetical protein